jgi:GDP-D-mannose dehydratase
LGISTRPRDFGYPDDYVEAMWRMFQQDDSIHWVLDMAFRTIGIEDWSSYVATDDRVLRSAEVDQLVGDASRAEETLGWMPKVWELGGCPRRTLFFILSHFWRRQFKNHRQSGRVGIGTGLG